MISSKSGLSKNTPATLQWVAWASCIVVSCLLVAYVVITIGLALLDWNGRRAEALTAVVPVPAGFIASRPIWFGDYLNHAQAMARYNEYVASLNSATFTTPSQDEIRRLALKKIIRDRATMIIINRYTLHVSQADVDQAFTAQLGQSGDRQQVSTAIADYYGWSPDEFKTEVIRPALAREKLREKLSFDDDVNVLPRQQAERVMTIVQQGDRTFEELVVSYSEDVEDSDLGWFRRGDQLQEIDDAVFNLEVGQSSELIHTKYGWHILQLVAKRTVDDQEEVQARQIFIAAPNIDDFITRWLAGRVMLFVPGMAWDDAQGQVTKK